MDAAELEETPSVVALGVDRSFTDFAERHGRYRHTENKGADLVGKCRGEKFMDEDLDKMTRENLIDEVKKLRQGIRQHRDSSQHELCWHHPALWGLLPEKTDPLPVVPEWPEFIRGCVRYRQSLDKQAPNAPRTSEPYKE